MKHLILLSSLIFFLTSFSSAQLLSLDELDDMKAEKSLEDALEHPTEVIKLRLKGDDVFSIRYEISQFVNLQHLSLTGTKMTKFPKEVTKLINLQYLDLSKNKLTKIPDEISKLKNLKYLGMSRNDLYLISPEIGELTSMEELDLWNNPIKEFPEEMRGMKNLKRMDLRVVQLNEKEKKKLMKMFPYSDLKFSKTCDCN